jgi:hypothetical protein
MLGKGSSKIMIKTIPRGKKNPRIFKYLSLRGFK